MAQIRSWVFFVLMVGLLAFAGACANDGGAGSGGQTGTGGASQAGTKGGSGGTGSGGHASAGGTETGGSGKGGAGAGGASGAGGNSLANFATVHDIVFTLCGGSGCHQPANTQPALLVDDAKLYSTLMSFVSSFCGNRVLVKPGSPQDSAFYLAQAGQCGDSLPQMPLGCVDNCTPPNYLEGVRQWIANGAPQK